MAIAEELAALRERTLAEIAAADTSAALEAVRVAVLGKSGTLTGYLRSMGQVPAEERASVGKAVNAARVEVEEALAARKAALDAAELEAAMGAAAVDVTLPGRAQQVGTRHLINGIIDEVSDIFLGLGYKVVEVINVNECTKLALFFQFIAFSSELRLNLQKHLQTYDTIDDRFW